VPPQLEHAPHDANDDLCAGARDVDHAAYCHVPCFCKDGVWMTARIDDRAAFIGARCVALGRAELSDGHVGDTDRRCALAVEAQTLRDWTCPDFVDGFPSSVI